MKLLKGFINNDAYFMEVVSNKIIINDNYDGICIFDSELNIIANIKLLSDMVIDTSFIKGNEIILCCYENECLIYFHIDTFDYKIIPLSAELKDISFLSLFEWRGNDLILLSDNGTVFVQVNLSQGTINIISKNTIEKLRFSICDSWSKLNKFIIHKVYSNTFKAIVEIDNKLILMDYKNNTNTDLKIKPIKFHDIEINNNCVVQVSENEISVQYKNKNIKLYPQHQEYSFLRCRFITVNEVEYIILLICSNTNSLVGEIERYSIKAILN